jgi:hypothetical protein
MESVIRLSSAKMNETGFLKRSSQKLKGQLLALALRSFVQN